VEVSGAVQELLAIKWLLDCDWWDCRLFYCYTQTENFEHLKQGLVSKRTV